MKSYQHMHAQLKHAHLLLTGSEICLQASRLISASFILNYVLVRAAVSSKAINQNLGVASWTLQLHNGFFVLLYTVSEPNMMSYRAGDRCLKLVIFYLHHRYWWVQQWWQPVPAQRKLHQHPRQLPLRVLPGLQTVPQRGLSGWAHVYLHRLPAGTSCY